MGLSACGVIAQGTGGGSGGATWHDAVHYATVAALPANTVSSGAGTITANANGALTVDGVAVGLNEYVLVRNELSGGSPTAANGIYQSTQLGDGSHPFVLTRRTTENSTGSVLQGSKVEVLAGQLYAGRAFRLATTGTITMGTTAQDWRLSQASRRPNYAFFGLTPVVNFKLSGGAINVVYTSEGNVGSGGAATLAQTGTDWYQMGPDASACGEGCVLNVVNGGSSYLSVASSIALGSTPGLFAIVTPNFKNSSDNAIWGKYVLSGGTGSQTVCARLGMDSSGHFFFEANVNGTLKRATSSQVAELGQRYTIAGYYDNASAVHVLVDGIELGSTAATGAFAESGTTPTYVIGNKLPTPGLNTMFTGLVEEVAAFTAVPYPAYALSWTSQTHGQLRTV